ncbi:hypothetical protein [Streptomyces malaysiensis]|uniref:hypothetical protein n=1 Tax=Streptomyces malaysiensis TaxID=92644 RepID=UPI0037172448
MARPSRYPLELRRRAVRMVAEVRDDYPNETAALQAVAEKLGIGFRETLRNWGKQQEIDAGQRPGTTTAESVQLKVLKKEAATVEETVFVLDTLEMAIWQRDRDQQPTQPAELVHQSDAGARYISFRLAEHLDAAGIAASIGSVDAYDSALMESRTVSTSSTAPACETTPRPPPSTRTCG